MMLLIYIICIAICKRSLFSPSPKFFAGLYLVHSRIVFFAVQSFLLGVLNSYKEKGNSLHYSAYYKHNWYGLTILLTGINPALALIPEFLLYHTGSRECSYAVKNNLYHKIALFYKALLLVFDFFAESLVSIPQVTASIHFIFAIILTQTIYVKLPFMNFAYLKIVTILTAIILSLSFTLFLQSLTPNKDFINSLQVSMFLLPVLMVKILLSAVKRLFERIVNQTTHSPDHMIHYALLMGELSKDNKEGSAIDKSLFPSISIFNGLLAKSGIDLVTMNGKKNKKDCGKVLYTFAMEKLERYVSNNSTSPDLLLFMAQIYSEKLENIIRATELIKKVETSQSTIPVGCAIKTLYCRIENMQRKNPMNLEKRLELTNYIQSTTAASLLRKDMLKEVQTHAVFWEKLKKDVVDVYTAIGKAETIDKISQRVYQKYQRSSEIFEQSFVLPVLLYAVYLSYVRNNIREGTQVFKKFQHLFRDHTIKNKGNTESENTATLILSLDKKRLGEVIYATGLVKSMFFLGKDMLIGNNFGCLFPSVIAKELQYLIQDYVTSSNRELATSYSTYGKTRYGHIFNIEAHFCLYSYLSKGVTIMLTLKKTSTPRPLMIINADGLIIDSSCDIEEVFAKERLYLKSFKSVQNISSELEYANMAFNMMYCKKKGSKPPVSRMLEHKEEPIPETIKSIRSETRQLLSNAETEDRGALERALSIKEGTTQQLYNFQTIWNGAQGEDTPHFLPSPKDAATMLKGLPLSLKYLGKTSLFPELIKVEKDMTLMEAEELCRAFTEGKKVILNRIGDHLTRRRRVMSANIQVKPLIVGGEVYKVVIVDDLRREVGNTGSLHHGRDKYQSLTNIADEVSEGLEIDFPNNMRTTRGGQNDVKILFTERKRVNATKDKSENGAKSKYIKNDDFLSSARDQSTLR